MAPKEFVVKYYPFALEAEKETFVPAIAIMAQAALESGWGKYAIGNNIFGIKFRTGDWKSQTVLTTEYSSDPKAFSCQNVKSKVYDKDSGKYKFKVWQYFADYETPKDAFLAHSELLLTYRYMNSRRYRHSPKRFLIAVWRCGYATDINYGRKMCNMVDSINKRL